MSKKSAEADSAATEVDIAELSKALIKKDNKITELEQRLSRIEKRTKSNERFARTLSECLGTQVCAIDAVAGVLRRSLREEYKTNSRLPLKTTTNINSVVGFLVFAAYCFGLVQSH